MDTNYIPPHAPGFARRAARLIGSTLTYVLRIVWKAITLYARFTWWFLTSMFTAMLPNNASLYDDPKPKRKRGLF